MQYHNNDIEKLFKEAADQYPLRTDGSDWEKVAAVLNEKERTGTAGHWKYLWLLLLILPAAGYFMYTASPTKNDPSVVERSTSVKEQKPSSPITSDDQNAKDHLPTKNISGTANAIRSAAQTMLVSGSTKHLADLSFSAALLSATKNDDQKDQAASSVKHNDTDAVLAKEDSKDVARTTDPTIQQKENTLEKRTEQKAEQRTIPEERSSAVAAPQIRIDGKEPQGFYVVATGGMDISTVKMQKTNGIGNSVGLLVGYQIDPRIGFEAGVLWSTKRYYSDAKYFNAAKLNNPWYLKWETLEGECRMIEIPVAIRISLRQTPATKWFTTAGASSYLMKKESYDYDYKYYSQNRKGYKEWTNSGNFWTSAIHFSGGVEKKIGSKATFLRIEPYIRIPVLGVGYGSLPISSAGINIGIRKDLF